MKKSLAVILTVIMICSALCACSNETTSTSTSTAVPSATAPSVTQEPVATDAPEVEIVYDEKLFTIENTTLVKYLGSEDTVTVPDGITTIGKSAFENCTSVISVSLPESVTKIEGYAFTGCSALSDINIPKNVASIAEYAFAKCTSLKQIIFPAKTVEIGEGILSECSALEEATISSSSRSIPDKAFYGCSNLTYISIPGSAKTIGTSAFEGCKRLCEVEFGKGIESIGSRAFYGCTHIGISLSKLEKIEDGDAKAEDTKYEIDIPNSIVSIDSEAFDETNFLKNAVVAAEKTDIDNTDRFITLGKHGMLIKYVLADADAVKAAIADKDVFDGQNIDITYNAADNSIVVNNLKLYYSVKYISTGAFDGIRDKIEVIDLEDASVKKINVAAFADMTALKEITLTNDITEIYADTFRGCTNLETVTIKGEITSIADNAFKNCTKLTKIITDTNSTEPFDGVDLSDDIVVLGNKVFSGCSSIKNVILSDKLTSIGEYCFEGCSSVADVQIGSAVTFIGIKAFDGTNWFDNWSGDDVTKTLVVGDMILIKSLDGSIPEGTKTIAAYTFAAAKTEIAEKEFYNSTLPLTITIPGTVTKISDYAFYYATNLQTVIIEEGVKEIGQKAFYGCSALTSITIPSSVTQISDYSFYKCTSLTDITLPDSIVKIGKYAFYDCLGLENITYNAAAEIGEEAFTNTKVEIKK